MFIFIKGLFEEQSLYRILKNFEYRQEPITRSLQLPHIPVTAFSQTYLFLVCIVEFLSPQARTNVDMSTCSCEAALFYSY